MRILAFILLLSFPAIGQTVTVATANIWTGLSYKGVFRIGSFESADTHEQRIRGLIRNLRAANVDILALQEVNPVPGLADRIADELGYSVISQRVLSGVKLGPVGVPINLDEGLAILARPEFDLRFIDVWPLSHTFGGIGTVFSFHLSEQNAALVGRVRLASGETAVVINTHLPAFPMDDTDMRSALSSICARRGLSPTETAEWLEELSSNNAERSQMVDEILTAIDQHFPSTPVILMGDFNLPDASPVLQKIRETPGYTDVSRVHGTDHLFTWEPSVNTNTRFSTAPPDTDRAQETPIDELSRVVDGAGRRLDYIFMRTFDEHGTAPRVRSVSLMLDTPVDGVFSSDHFGLRSTLDLRAMKGQDEGLAKSMARIEWLPLFSYDTDVGFGYGVKAFLLGQLGQDESFDLILFNSTKGERWYRLVYSMPDFELRQGTVYPFALDVTLDYDKYLQNVYFGIGPGSRYDDREVYTREPFEAHLSMSRGFTPQTVAQAGIRHRTIRNSNISDSSAIPFTGSVRSTGTASATALTVSLRHDTRDSYINPSRGMVLGIEGEYAPRVGNVSFLRLGGMLQWYSTLMYPKTVCAIRVSGQSIDGPNIPIQFLLPVGGNQTLRGFPQDRFLGRTTVIANLELRFPLVWRFGAVAGVDAGKVWMRPGEISLADWKANAVFGIRFFMDTFIVRADLGFGPETTGFYLNFGHLF